jgi:hypothetical protein
LFKAKQILFRYNSRERLEDKAKAESYSPSSPLAKGRDCLKVLLLYYLN